MYRPKVGEECEYLWSSMREEYCLVFPVGYNTYGDLIIEFLRTPDNTRIGEIEIVSKDSIETDWGFGYEFRPAKSKRDEEIEDLTNIFTNMNRIESSPAGIAQWVYMNGYRKQLPYSQFVSIIQQDIAETFDLDDHLALNSAVALAEKLNRTPEDTL